MRPKTFRRLVILATVVVVVLGSVTWYYVYQKQKLAARIAENRRVGMAAVASGDKQVALDQLSSYLSRVKDDPEAMIAFANVRRTVPRDKAAHLREAANWYSEALQRQPDNFEAKHALLEIYSQIGFATEAKTLAAEVLKAQPNDQTALTALLAAQVQAKEYEAALETADRLAAIDPLDYRAQSSAIDLMFETKRPVEAIQARAAALHAAHPDDPRFELVQALAWRGDPKVATEWIGKAAARTPPNADFARDLVRIMERAGMFAAARAYLERSADSVDDPQVLLVLAQRLWQDRKYDQVLERLALVSPTDPSADSDLLAIKALSSRQGAAMQAATQPAERRAATTRAASDLTAQIVDSLSKRPNDAAARTWAAALRTLVIAPPTTAREKVRQLTDAISAGRDNGIVRFLLAEADLELGETEAALGELRTAAARMPSWEAPHVLSARVLLAGGRHAAAMEAAQAAAQRDPQNVGAAIVYCLAWYARLGESPDPKDSERLLDQVTKLQMRARPDGEPQTLPIYVSLLARAGNRDAAVAAARVALATSRPYSTEPLLQLAAASRVYKLGVEGEILDHAERLYGGLPQIALARANLLADTGKPADGLKLLEAASAKAGKPDALPWPLLIAQYRETTRDPQAGPAWAKVGDAFPDSLPVQSAVINAPSRFEHRDAWRRAIDRMRKLTGDGATQWQIENARYVLSGNVDTDGKELSGVLNGLAALTRQNPDMIEPRILLAGALVQAKSIAGAIAQLEAATQLRPNDATIALQLYELLRDQGRLDESRTYLERLGANKTLSGENRVRVAAALADAGQAPRAIDLLATATPGESAAVPRDALLARLYRRAGNVAAAARVYERWLTVPAPDASLLQAGADFFATTGKDDIAAQFLGRLTEAQLRPGQRELILAQHQENHGSRDEAEKLFAAATQVAPTDANAWRQRVAFEIRARRYDRAQTYAAEGLTKVPDDGGLKTLQQQAKLFTSETDTDDLQPLVDLLSRDPRNAPAAATLKVLSDAKAAKQPTDKTVAQLRELADRYPQFLPLQGMLARGYLAAGRTDDAAAIATRAEQLFPADAQAARLATQVYAQSARADSMLAAAQRWRRLAVENPIDADAAIARAQVMNRDLDAATRTLAPHLAQARLDPDRYPDVMSAHAQLLVASGKANEAAELLAPLANGSARWRQVWLSLATTHPGADAAMSWVERVPQGPSPTTEERFTVAATWYDVATRYHRPDALARAKAILTDITSGPDASVRHWRLLAYACRDTDDLPGAEAAFRKALTLDPNQPDTLNNVAFLALLRGGDLAEAQKFAEQAIAGAPRSASYLDTLARIQDKQGDTAGALDSFNKALDLEPRNLESLVGKAAMLLRAGRKDEASNLIPQLDQATSAAGTVPSPLKEQLDEVRKNLAP